MIFFPTSNVSVMTMIWCVFEFSSANMRPMHIAISLASNGVILVACALSQLVTLLSFQMWVIAVVEPIILTLLSVMTVISTGAFCVSLNATSSFDE